MITCDNRELFLFDQKLKKSHIVEYGDAGKDYIGQEICNLQIAFNSKFFAVAFPKKRAFGVFKIDRKTLRITPPDKWITKVSLS